MLMLIILNHTSVLFTTAAVWVSLLFSSSCRPTIEQVEENPDVILPEESFSLKPGEKAKVLFFTRCPILYFVYSYAVFVQVNRTDVEEAAHAIIWSGCRSE